MFKNLPLALNRSAYTTLTAALVVAALPNAANTTNGMFVYGHGPTSKGMAGLGAAYSNDALAVAANPAGMSWVGSRVDADITFFNPNRGVSIDAGSTIPAVESGNIFFLLPNFGVNHDIDETSSIGVFMQSVGGMSTHYKEDVFLGFQGFGRPTATTGIDLAQGFLGINYSHKITPNHSIGIAPYFAAQRFRATGLEPFANAGLTIHTKHVTGNGADYSYGFGGRIGYQGRFMNDTVWSVRPTSREPT